MRKKVLLVFPDVSERTWHKGYFHYGLAHISSYLKKSVRDIEVSLLPVRDRDISEKDFIAAVAERSPDVIGFTSTSHSFPLIAEFARWVKSYDREILTVAGGIHVTLNTEEALVSTALDIAVRGDGEHPMEAIVNEWTLHNRIPDAPGVWRKDGGRVVSNGLSSAHDLDGLPDPDWEIFDYLSLDDGSQGIGGFMLSRGCPYQCTYCCNHKILNIYKENNASYIRFKSVDKSISEIKNFIAKYPQIHTLYFDDDILPLKRKWFLEFAHRYGREIKKPYWCNVRPNLVDTEIVDAFVASGCVRAGIGIESGAESLRNGVLKRNISDESIISAVELLKKSKVYVYSFNMVGVPGETKREILDTVRLNSRLGVDKMQCSIFYPYKHTASYDYVVKEGLVEAEKTLIEYSHESIMKFGFTQKNRIYFTALTINIIARFHGFIGKALSEWAAEIFLKALYSSLSAVMFLPIVNFIMKRLLSSERVSVNIRKIFRKIIPPPPTAAEAE